VNLQRRTRSKLWTFNITSQRFFLLLLNVKVVARRANSEYKMSTRDQHWLSKTLSFNPNFSVNLNHFSLCINTATLLAACLSSYAFAQAPGRAAADKIMTREELRTCMKLKASNEKNAATIQQEQQNFTRDQESVKAEQAEVSKGNNDLRTRLAVINAERDAMAAIVAELSAKAPTLKTDAEKAEYEAERVKLIERNRVHQQNTEAFNAAQQTHSERVAAFNTRVDAINQRSKTVNDRVEPHQEQLAAWRSQCGNRRFREEDEIVIKKELAATK
jgi:hypothetical protein